MLRKVENEPVMTVAELRKHYANNWFRYVILDEDAFDRPIEIAQAQVVFLADTKDELLGIPAEQRCSPGYPGGGNNWGVRVNPEHGIQIGGHEIAWV